MASDGKLIFDTQIDTKGFDTGTAKIKSLGSSLSSGLGSIAKVGAASIVALGTGLVAASGYTVKLAIDFESAFAGVRKTVDATEEDFAKLEKGILDMSTQIPYAAKDIASVAESAGQLGIETPNILSFTETMLKLGDATNLTAEEAATSFARFANITSMPQTQFENLGSTVVALGNNLATTEAEIVSMGMRLAGTGTQIGLTHSQIMGFAGALSSVGINAEAGGSAISRVMQKMNTEVLGSGKKLKDFAKVSGMSAEEFTNAWKSNPQEAITSFVKGLGEINKSGGDVAGTLKELGINSVQEIDTLSRLSNNTEVLTNALNIANEAWAQNTALTKEAEQRYATTEMKIKLLGTSLQTLGIRVGQDLVEGMRGSITQLQSYINELSIAFEEGGLGALADKTGEIIGDIAVNIASKAPDFINSGTQIITAILNGISSRQAEVASSAVEIANSLVQGISQVTNNLIDIGANIVESLAQGISANHASIGASAASVINNFIMSLLKVAPQAVEAGAKVILSVGEGIAKNSDQLTQYAVKAILSLINTFTTNIPKMVKIGADIIKGVAKGLWDSKGEIIKHIPQILAALTVAFAAFKGASIGKDLIMSIATGMSATGPITLIGGRLVTQLATSMVAKEAALATVGSQLVTAVGTGLSKVGASTLGTAATSLITTLGTKLAAGAPIIAAVGTKLVAALVAVLSNPIGLAVAAGGLVLLIAKGIFGKKKDVEDATRETVEGGINSGIEQVEPNTEGLIEKLMTGLQNGSTSVQEAYNQMLEVGLDGSQAREVIYASGVELGDEFIKAIGSNAEGVKVAFAELRADGFTELSAIDKLIELGVLNVEAFGNGVEDGKQGLYDKIAELKEQQLSEADIVAELFEIQSRNIQDGVLKATDDNLPIIAQRFESYAQTFGNSLGALDLFREKGLFNLEAFGTGAEEGYQKVQELYTRFSEEGLTALEILERFKNIGLLNMGEGYASGLLEGGMRIDEVYNTLKEKGLTVLEMTEMLKSLGYQNVESFLAGMGEKAPEMETTLNDIFKTPLERLGVTEEYQNKGGEMSEGVATGLQEGSSLVLESANQLRDQALEGLEGDPSGPMGKAEKMINDYNQKIAEKAPEAKTATSEVSKQAASGFDEGEPLIKASAEKNIKAAIDAFKSKSGEAKSTGSEVGKSAVSGVDEGLSGLKSSGTKGGTEFVSGIKSQATQAQAAGKSLIDAVGKGITSGQASVKTNITTLLTQVSTTIKSKNTEFNNLGKELIKQLSQGMTSSGNQVSTSVTSILQSAQNTASGQLGAFITIGNQISQGIAKGVSAGGTAVQTAVGNVVNAAVRKAQMELKIHSPSKRAEEEIGDQFSLGIAVGVKKSANSIYDEVGKISDSMLSHMAKSHDKISIFQEEKEKERLDKIKQLNIGQIDKAYQEYNTLHKNKIDEIENQIISLQEQKEAIKSGKKTEARKKELEADIKLNQDKKKLLEDYSKNFEETYTKMVDDYSKAMDEIESKTQTLADKLKNYGDVLETVRDAEGNVMKDEYGNDALQLVDLNGKIARVTEYGGLMSELQRRGADVDVMTQMVTMDVERAIQYAKALLQKGEGDFAAYMEQMKVLRETSQKIAEQVYAQQAKDLEDKFVTDAEKKLQTLTGKSQKIGEDSAKKLTEGFNKNSPTFSQAVEKLMQNVDKAFNTNMSNMLGNGLNALRDFELQAQQVFNSFSFNIDNQTYPTVSTNMSNTDVFSNDFQRAMRGRGVPI